MVSLSILIGNQGSKGKVGFLFTSKGNYGWLFLKASKFKGLGEGFIALNISWQIRSKKCMKSWDSKTLEYSNSIRFEF